MMIRLARSMPRVTPAATTAPVIARATAWKNTGCQTDALYRSQYAAVSTPARSPVSAASTYLSAHPVTTE